LAKITENDSSLNSTGIDTGELVAATVVVFATVIYRCWRSRFTPVAAQRAAQRSAALTSQ